MITIKNDKMEEILRKTSKYKDKDGTLWYSATDFLQALGYKKSSITSVVKRSVPDTHRKKAVLHTDKSGYIAYVIDLKGVKILWQKRTKSIKNIPPTLSSLQIAQLAKNFYEEVIAALETESEGLEKILIKEYRTENKEMIQYYEGKISGINQCIRVLKKMKTRKENIIL